MYSYTLTRDLECRFDGDMPDELRRAAVAGGQAALMQFTARSNSRCCDRLALSAVRAAAARRDSGSAVAFWRGEGLSSLSGQYPVR